MLRGPFDPVMTGQEAEHPPVCHPVPPVPTVDLRQATRRATCHAGKPGGRLASAALPTGRAKSRTRTTKEYNVTQLVQVEAYLGPELPDTIAEAVVSIPEGKDHRDYHYAVVRQDYESGKTSVVSLDESEEEALKEVRLWTTERGFGILCNVRTAPVAELEAEAHSVS